MDFAEYKYDDDLIAACVAENRPVLDIYPFGSTAAVLGRGSKPDLEIHHDECMEHDVPVLRRRGGGCAVLLDQGNVIVSVVLPDARLGNINETFEIISAWLIDGLADSGVNNVHREGICDLVTGDRKVGGACMQRKKHYVYYSCSLMFDPDIDLMEKLIRHPPREPQYRRHRGHRDFIGSIKDITGLKNIDMLNNALRTHLTPGSLYNQIC